MRGVKVALATARQKYRVDILPFIGLADAIITDNGASVYICGELAASFGIP
jgi:hydroxymethylpyrimidine pyrophosphatase-like HAD family hydrolase